MDEYVEEARVRISTERKKQKVSLDFVVSRKAGTTGYRDLTPEQARRVSYLLLHAANDIDGRGGLA